MAVRSLLVVMFLFAPSQSFADEIWCGTAWLGASRPFISRLFTVDEEPSAQHVEPDREIAVRGVHDPRLAVALRHAVFACGTHGTMHVRIAVTSDGVVYALGETCLNAQLHDWRLPRATGAQLVDAVVVW
jgi:hypothetical protein